MNFTMFPGGALLEDAVALEPAIQEAMRPAIMSDQYTSGEVYAKVVNTLAPIREQVNQIMEQVSVTYEGAGQMVEDINMIESTMNMISRKIPLLLSKLCATFDLMDKTEYAKLAIHTHSKFIIMNRKAIMSAGLSEFRAEHAMHFPVVTASAGHFINAIAAFYDADNQHIMDPYTLKSIVPSYDADDLDQFESLDQLLSIIFEGGVAYTRHHKKSEYTCDVIRLAQEVVQHTDDIPKITRGEYLLWTQKYAKYISSIVKGVIPRGHDLMTRVDDNVEGGVDNIYYRNQLSLMIAPMVNAFYIGSILCLCMMFRIMASIDTRHDLEKHVSTIVSEVK